VPVVDRRLRVAAHNGASVYGGGEKWTLLLLAGLRDRGHEVHFFCRDDAMRARAESMGIPSSVGRLGGQLMIPDALRFSRQLRKWSPDALLVSTFKKIWLAGMAARWARVPRIVSRIGLSTDLPRRHWTYRHAFRRWVDAVLVNADGIRQNFLADMPNLDPRSIVTVYDGIELREGPSRTTARRALGLPLDVPVVGSVTRLSAQKRLDRMLEAVAPLAEVHLVLAGDGDLEGRLRELADSLAISQRVHFLGFREDVPLVLAALDLFLITSDKEGMANAMLEAMAAGVPVVSTPVSGAAEALEGGEPSPGRIVAPTPGAITAAVEEILSDPARRADMSDAARVRALERFAFAPMVDAWEHVLGGGDPASVHRGPSALAV
jgi:glycosyltransferase involved in cell wall biosynthesis